MANLGSGLSGFTQGFAQGAIDREEIMARRNLAKQKQQQSQLQMQEYNQQAPLREAQSTLALEQAQVETKKLRGAQVKEATYSAFNAYNVDGEVRHLNNFLSTAKRLDPNSMFSRINRVDKLSGIERSEAIQMLTNAGVPDAETVFDDANKAYVVSTDASGQRTLVSLAKLQGATGYTQYTTKNNLELIKQQAEIETMLTGPKSAETSLIRDIAKQQNIPLYEATKLYKQAASKRAPSSTVERIAQTIRENNPGMSDEESIAEASALMKTGGTEDEREARQIANQQGVSYTQALDDVNARRERSSTRVKLDETQTVRQQLDDTAGGSFLESNLSDPIARRKAGPLITELEALTGQSLTTEDKRVARSIRDLTALGQSAGENITDAETGLIDRMLRQVKSYVSNEVGEGTAGTAAYETFRNVFRNSLYGASLTESEIKAFNTAMGTLGQQTGPVLAKLNESMRSMSQQLKAIYDMNDEYVAHYYLGKSLDELDAAIESIDERISLVGKGLSESSSAERITAQPVTAAPVAPEDISSKLDSIFGGAK